MLIVSTAHEFQDFLKQSLISINEGDWHSIDYKQIKVNAQQREIIDQLKGLCHRFETIVE